MPQKSIHLVASAFDASNRRERVIVREVARGRASGVQIDGRRGYVITVRDRQIVRIRTYRDAGQALQAVGIGEPGIGA